MRRIRLGFDRVSSVGGQRVGFKRANGQNYIEQNKRRGPVPCAPLPPLAPSTLDENPLFYNNNNDNNNKKKILTKRDNNNNKIPPETGYHYIILLFVIFPPPILFLLLLFLLCRSLDGFSWDSTLISRAFFKLVSTLDWQPESFHLIRLYRAD